jgi:hypothetical protein
LDILAQFRERRAERVWHKAAGRGILNISGHGGLTQQKVHRRGFWGV